MEEMKQETVEQQETVQAAAETAEAAAEVKTEAAEAPAETAEAKQDVQAKVEAVEATEAPAETAEAKQDAQAEAKAEDAAAAEAPAEAVAETPAQAVEAVEAPAEATETPSESMADYAAELEASFRKISEGDILTGTVIGVSEDGVVLDLRYYAQGVIKAEDMSDAPGFSVLRDVKEGDVIQGTVLRLDDGQGNIQLSRKAASDVLAWDKLKVYLEEKTDLTVKVSGTTNGGVIAYLEDVRGFIPASQLSLDYVEDTNPWLGKELKVRVITVDKGKKKLVMSAKAVLREEAAREKERRIAMVVPGSVLEGTVESLMPYGAFINLGDGLSGLVHISQISQKRIKKPSEVLNVGDKVKAKVLNTNNGKISLSMKALQEAEEKAEADKIEDFHYKSEGNVTTSLGSIFAKMKLDL